MMTNTTPKSLAMELRGFVDEAFLFGVEMPYTDNDSFMENSIIDSTGVLELIAHLEESYGLEINDADLVPENLDSIANLVAFIGRKQAAAMVP